MCGVVGTYDCVTMHTCTHTNTYTPLPLQRALKSGFRNHFICCCHRRYILSTFCQPVRSNIFLCRVVIVFHFLFFIFLVSLYTILLVFIVTCGIVCTMLSLIPCSFMCFNHFFSCFVFIFVFVGCCLRSCNIYSISFGKCSCSVSSIHLIQSILAIGLF